MVTLAVGENVLCCQVKHQKQSGNVEVQMQWMSATYFSPFMAFLLILLSFQRTFSILIHLLHFLISIAAATTPVLEEIAFENIVVTRASFSVA